MVKIFIDDKALEVKEGMTVLRAAEDAGVHIPHFCYHPAFVPEGSCRMCLVEIEGLPKLDLACSTIVREGMKIHTKSPEVVEARRSVLEFLLAEHPLDCPICDKAGECKLQDYFEEYGLFENQFKEGRERRDKKFRISKNLILDRERCILCTRCVRFLNEVTKTEDAGVLDRGIHSEINIYESEFVDNNYAGNLAEICPVGAITDTDFRFKMRAWFLETNESICPLCSRGCNIVIDSHPGFPRVPMAQRVYRIRARENPQVNFHWICDFGRYNYAYLDKGRQDKIIMNKGGRETELSWEKVLLILSEKMKGLLFQKKNSRISIVLTSWLTNEELFLADRLFGKELQLANLYLADPPQGKGDGFLLTEDCAPNRRGLQEIGLPGIAPNLEALAAQTDILLIFGNFLADIAPLAELKNVFNKIKSKVLFAPHKTNLDALVDIIIPTPLIAEKSGSLTNIDGRIQAFSPALEFQAEGLPESKILAELAKALPVNHKYFWPLASPKSISGQMAKEIPFFR